MPSSISSSKDNPATLLPESGVPKHRENGGPCVHITRAHLVALLVTVLACCTAIEAGTRLGFHRFSRIEHRIATEHASLFDFARKPSIRPLLLVGDSLLLKDVDMDTLNRGLHAGLPLQRFSIEQTSYLDWLFGIRRILAGGVRPSTILLCIAPSNLISSAIRGDYSAHYLFRARDIPAIAKTTKYDFTMESGLLVSHYSLFYAGRNNLRTFMLYRVYPAYGNLMHNLLTRPAQFVSRDEVFRISESRFQEMKQLCASYSTHLVYLIPPSFGIHEDAIAEAGARAGVPVLAPVHTDAWPLSKFSDAFHLNEAGSREFTAILAPSLDMLLQSFNAQPTMAGVQSITGN